MNDENKNVVLEAIKTGKAKMRPRWLFTLQAALVIVVTFIVILVLVYVMSFIAYELDETGLSVAPHFGPAGWYIFAGSLPWLLIFLCALAILLVTLLMRHYSFSYHWPVLYSLVAVIFLTIGGSAVIVRTPLYGAIFREGPGEHLILVGRLYRGFAVPDIEGIYRGQVMQIATSGFLFADTRGRTSTVLIASGTALPTGQIFVAGDTVVVFGDRASGTIYAYGVERLAPAPIFATSSAASSAEMQY